MRPRYLKPTAFGAAIQVPIAARRILKMATMATLVADALVNLVVLII